MGDQPDFDAIRENARRGMEEFLRQQMEAAKREPADVIAADEVAPMSEENFDDALWSALCGRVDRGDDVMEWPVEVRAYYATRMVDWEVGNGGFRQALTNVPECFPHAIAGYELLGRPDLANLLRNALGAPDPAALDALDEQLDVNDDLRVAYVRAHRDAFRLSDL
jgi:hypothetical protein